jgi:hypothetical protein
MKLDLLTNATVVDDAIRPVSSNKAKDKHKSLGNIDEYKESDEPNYEPVNIKHTSRTINEVF